MTILLAALGVAFAAFAVWLLVRIINRREKWAKWTAAVYIVLMVLVGYPLSFGPVVSCVSTAAVQPAAVGIVLVFYMPLVIVAEATRPTKELLQWYVHLWADNVTIGL